MWNVPDNTDYSDECLIITLARGNKFYLHYKPDCMPVRVSIISKTTSRTKPLQNYKNNCQKSNQ